MSTNQQKYRCCACVAATAVASLMFLGVLQPSKAQQAPTNSPAQSPRPGEKLAPASGAKQSPDQSKSSKGNSGAKQPKLSPKQLTGAELYSMHCARCHPERYPNDRTSAQWKTIGLHMRVRANLPAEHFRKVLKYLQDNSGY